jgi:Transcriptional regulators
MNPRADGGGGAARERMSDRIVRDYLERIGSGQLAEGAPVPAESRVAEEYGVSRSVVREAVRSLAAKGFVIASQGSSTVVAPKPHWNVLDPDFLAVNTGEDFFDHLQQARELLEPSIVAVAVLNITDEQVDELEQLHRDFTSVTDPERHARFDVAFHEAIATATGNPVLVALHSLISGLGYRTRVRSAEIPGGVERASFWHAQIIEALRARNAADAESAMRLHLRQVRGELEVLGVQLTPPR